MADGFHSLIQQLKRHSPKLRAGANPEWGSEVSGHRGEIRASLKKSLEKDCKDDLACFDDMDEPPRPKKWSVSISHTKGFGAWIAIPRPLRVGLDIEDPARVTQAVIERTCSPDEMEAAPELSYLWCAKEAYYKSLEGDQPDAITQISIGDWNDLGGGLYGYRGHDGAKPGAGLLLEADGYLYSVCFVS